MAGAFRSDRRTDEAERRNAGWLASSPEQAIRCSPDVRTGSLLGVIRSADDSGAPRPYRSAMRFPLAPERLDAVLAVALVLVAEVQTAFGPARGWILVAEAIVAGLVTASVAIRRRWPAAVGFGVQALLVTQEILVNRDLIAPPPAGAVTVAWFCALYALAVWTTGPWFIAGLSFFIASDVAPALGDPAQLRAIWNFTAVVVLVMVFVRILVGRRDRQLRLAERERDLARREAVVDERARIARELHDAIAHHVSMMVVQAGAERRVLAPGQESTKEVLSTIERVGRSALTEMRRLVGMLRGDETDDLEPQPGLAAVPALVAGLRDAGFPVELRIDGERRDLPLGIELSAYRVVQEGLTNALKHAGRAHVRVHVGYGPRSLELEIADDGTGTPAALPAGGHGLAGIEERVALYGGELQAGQGSDGGFVLRVLLPTR
jgi:signal transduction histidine kinase